MECYLKITRQCINNLEVEKILLTLIRVAKLPAGHIGIFLAPIVVTHVAPGAMEAHFHQPLQIGAPSNESDVSHCTFCKRESKPKAKLAA